MYEKPEKPFIVPFFIPHAGCPYRCIYCDQTILTGQAQAQFSHEGLQKQVQTCLRYKGSHRNSVQLAFYGGNFLGQKTETVRTLLDAATPLIQKKVIDSIRFSTRPDTIDFKRLKLLKNYPVKTVELGAQSMDDQVLKSAFRGHTADDTKNAVQLLRGHGYDVGLQMMIGLPEESAASSISSAYQIAGLKPDFVRIYPTVVLEKSDLAKCFQQGTYIPLSLDEAVALTKKLYLIFKQRQIPVIRMGLQASTDLGEGTAVLAGPYHPAFGHLVFASIFLDQASSLLKTKKHGGSVTFSVNPKSYSRLQGLRKENIIALKKLFSLESVRILSDNTLSSDELLLS